jgi:hypothetical protein
LEEQEGLLGAQEAEVQNVRVQQGAEELSGQERTGARDWVALGACARKGQAVEEQEAQLTVFLAVVEDG